MEGTFRPPGTTTADAWPRLGLCGRAGDFPPPPTSVLTMRHLSPDHALALHRIADGEAHQIPGTALSQWAAEGLVRIITGPDAADLRQHEALLQEVEQLREEARGVQRPPGLRRIAVAVLPGTGRMAWERARGLRDVADGKQREAQRQWLALSQRALVGIDLDLCGAQDDGSFVQITDLGREAIRDVVYSEYFEREAVDPEGIGQRATVFLELRAHLLAAGFEPDARLDLAAALLSRHDQDVHRFREVNRLATVERWQSYDRLPLVAALCGLEGQPEDIWERFWRNYDAIRRHDRYPGSYETRYAAAAIMHHGEVDDAACGRLWEVAKRLRYDGWPLSQSTDPVAARLMRLRLSPTRITTRVQRLFGELERGADAGGPFLGLAAAVAADSNLHQLTVKHESAEVMQERSQFAKFVARYDQLLPRCGGEGSRRAFAPAFLALLPGTAAGNWQRFNALTEVIGKQIARPNVDSIAMMLMDAACSNWFDATRFLWEIGSLLAIGEAGSVFTAYGRMSPVYERAASKAGGGKVTGTELGI